MAKKKEFFIKNRYKTASSVVGKFKYLNNKMTDLGYIVKMVIYQCRELGNPVTETLAAYVAQTILNENTG